jgi:cyclase
MSLRRRVIPVVLMRGGIVVQSRGFRRYRALGNPVTIVERLSAWGSDELVYLDITAPGSGYDLGRDDLGSANLRDPHAILRDVARRCFMPLASGGGVRGLDGVAARLEAGADKVVVRTAALDDPGFLDAAAREFGAQCIVLCLDAQRCDGGGWSVLGAPERDAVAWAREAASRGAGEIILQSADEDGRGGGYDLELVAAVAGAVLVQVVALGGAREPEQLAAGIDAGADAVAAANWFNFEEHSVHRAKAWLHEQGYAVRAPRLERDDRVDAERRAAS